MTLKELQEKVIRFRDARNWKQFHNPKDAAISLSLEALEVLEHFQWKNTEEMQEHIKKNKEEIGEELADTLYWILLMSNDFEIDLEKAFNKKMKQNAKKYPVSKAKGRHNKYTDYIEK